ncbi:hypothetical protein [Photobacterium salinisoli]|uniref:hypothetical protein n=1 Tax=Photobacterium salinisoli TaxID=1616783 RepID=UPI000EA3E865|nr:hypothetical protein [Photobacterium salinisoli]
MGDSGDDFCGKYLDDLERLIERIVLHENEKNELMSIISDARVRQTVPIRGIHQKIMDYRRKYSLYNPFTATEEKMIEKLLCFWS